MKGKKYINVVPIPWSYWEADHILIGADNPMKKPKTCPKCKKPMSKCKCK